MCNYYTIFSAKSLAKLCLRAPNAFSNVLPKKIVNARSEMCWCGQSSFSALRQHRSQCICKFQGMSSLRIKDSSDQACQPFAFESPFSVPLVNLLAPYSGQTDIEYLHFRCHTDWLNLPWDTVTPASLFVTIHFVRPTPFLAFCLSPFAPPHISHSTSLPDDCDVLRKFTSQQTASKIRGALALPARFPT